MPDWTKSKFYGHGPTPDPQQGLKLPTGKQAADIIIAHGFEQLSKDGYAYMIQQQPEFTAFCSLMVQQHRMSLENLTGAAFIIGLMLQTPKGE